MLIKHRFRRNSNYSLYPSYLEETSSVINGITFIHPLKQKEILEKLLANQDVFQKVVDMPSRHLLVTCRDMEYDDFTSPYLNKDIPTCSDLRIYSDKLHVTSTILEINTEL